MGVPGRVAPVVAPAPGERQAPVAARAVRPVGPTAAHRIAFRRPTVRAALLATAPPTVSRPQTPRVAATRPRRAPWRSMAATAERGRQLGQGDLLGRQH